MSAQYLFEQDPAPATVPAAGPAPRVLGLDLSLTSTGVCLPDGTTYRIKTRAADGDRRLTEIRDCIRDSVLETRPQLAVVEDLPMTANSAGVTGMVHGVARELLAVAGVPRALIVPATLKKYATNNGRADKAQMRAAAYLAAGAEFHGDSGGDRCDAWWLRAAGLDWWGTPEFVLPNAQRARLGKGKWPARGLVSR